MPLTMGELGLGAPRGGGRGHGGGGRGHGGGHGPRRHGPRPGRGFFPGGGYYPVPIYYDAPYYYPSYEEDPCVQVGDVVVCPAPPQAAVPVATLAGMGWSPLTWFKQQTAPSSSPARRPRYVTEYAEAYLSCRERNPEKTLRARGIQPFTPEDPCWDVWRLHEPGAAAVKLQQYKDEKAYQERLRLNRIRQQFPGKSMTVAAGLRPTPSPGPGVPIPWPGSSGEIDYRGRVSSSGLRAPTQTTKYPPGGLRMSLRGIEEGGKGPMALLVALGVGFWFLS